MLKNVIVMLGNECYAEKISVILNRRISIMLKDVSVIVKCAISICSKKCTSTTKKIFDFLFLFIINTFFHSILPNLINSFSLMTFEPNP